MVVADGASVIDRMIYCKAVSYLPDDILCKVDRAARRATGPGICFRQGG